MSAEIELKYAIVNRDNIEKIFNSHLIIDYIIEKPIIINMNSQYFDTKTGDFSFLKCAFRLRDENGKKVVTFKTPGTLKNELYVRGEWETDAENLESALLKLLKMDIPDKYKKFFDINLLEPLCSVSFIRKQANLKLSDGLIVQFSVDDGYLNNKHPFMEAEIELLEGNESSLLAFGYKISKEFNLVPEPASKLVRALSLINRN